MLVFVMPNLVQLQIDSSDPEVRRLLMKTAESAVKVGDAWGDKAEVDTQEWRAVAVLDYGRDQEH